MSDELSHKSRPRKVTAEGSGQETGGGSGLEAETRLDRWLEHMKGTTESSGLEGGAETHQDEWLEQLKKKILQKKRDEVEQTIENIKQREKLMEEYTKQKEKRSTKRQAEGAGLEGREETRQDEWLEQLIKNLRNKQQGYKKQRDKLLKELHYHEIAFFHKLNPMEVRHLMIRRTEELKNQLDELEELHEKEGNKLLEDLRGPQDKWLKSRYQKYLEKVQEKDWAEARKLRQELGTWYEWSEELNEYSEFRRYKERETRREKLQEYVFPRELQSWYRETGYLTPMVIKNINELKELYVKEKNELLDDLNGLQDKWLQSRHQKYVEKYFKETLEEINWLRREWFMSEWFMNPPGVGRYNTGFEDERVPKCSGETSHLGMSVHAVPDTQHSCYLAGSYEGSGIQDLHWRNKLEPSPEPEQTHWNHRTKKPWYPRTTTTMIRPPSPPILSSPHGSISLWRPTRPALMSSSFSHKSSPYKRFKPVPRLLRLMCQDVLQKNKIVREEQQSDTSTWSVSMQKDFRRHVGVRVHLKGAVLQAPGSEVILSIPSGLKVFVMGHIHTDPKPFLHDIPDDECLVAPIVDYTCMFKKRKSKASGTWFKISVPHCITNKKHLTEVRVRHGNIHYRKPFTRVPSNNCLFDVDEHHITIFTRSFSQFICTVCSKVCQGSARAYIFGSLTPLTLPPVHSSLRVYMCSPLYRINDYRQKLQEIEGRLQIKRHLVDESDVTWNPDDFREGEELCVAVQADWDPKKPIKRNETWDKDTRKLVQVRKVSEMLDMKHCHICKTDPSTVANFSFTEPPTTNGPKVALMFSGRLEMSTRGHRTLDLLEADFCVLPNEICTATTNDDHLRLRRVTKLIICTPEDLFDFGLGLGFSYNQVKQKRTDHSTSIVNAAMDVVVEWWDACTESYEDKVEFLVEVVGDISGGRLAARVREMMRKVNNEP